MKIKSFSWSGYHFDEERSSDTEYVFIRVICYNEKGITRQLVRFTSLGASPSGRADQFDDIAGVVLILFCEVQF